MRAIRTILLSAVFIGFAGCSCWSQQAAELPLDQALKKAQVGGKYRMLLKMLKIPGATGEYGGFNDFGFSGESQIGDYTDIPRGYWVYVYPYWYIWRDRPTGFEQKRAWGP